jgi:hypothetical protein
MTDRTHPKAQASDEWHTLGYVDDMLATFKAQHGREPESRDEFFGWLTKIIREEAAS